MKQSKIMMALLALFVMAVGTAFYFNPGLTDKTACEMQRSVAGGVRQMRRRILQSALRRNFDQLSERLRGRFN